MWQQIIPIIQNSQRFVLTAHVNPDGDALGTELALAEHLKNLGKEVSILNSDSPPTSLRFLDSRRWIKQYSAKKHAAIINRAEVIMVLDASGGWNRLGRIGDALEQAPGVKICIDHHPDSSDFVDLAVIDTAAAATAELVYDLVRAMDGGVTKAMAHALYAAIMTDTGSFRFPKTSPNSHRITAELLAAGADPLYIYRQIYEQNSPEYVRLKGYAMDSIQTAAGGQIAYYGLTKNNLKQYGLKSSELDGFASLGQQIKGVRVTIFCVESSNNRVKISLRSDNSVAINQIAAEYDGGGHSSAAGATITGTLAEVMPQLVKKVEALLKHQTVPPH